MWQSHVETIHTEHVLKTDRLTSELSAHKAEVKVLKAENAVLKDSTLVGEKQREIEEMKAEHEETLLLLREMGQKLEGAVSDRDQLAERLADDDKLIEQRTADKVVAEREKLRTVEGKMTSLSARTSEDAAKYRELEVEKNNLSNEVDDLTNWKAVYEAGHGMQELARQQRSLKGTVYSTRLFLLYSSPTRLLVNFSRSSLSSILSNRIPSNSISTRIYEYIVAPCHISTHA